MLIAIYEYWWMDVNTFCNTTFNIYFATKVPNLTHGENIYTTEHRNSISANQNYCQLFWSMHDVHT